MVCSAKSSSQSADFRPERVLIKWSLYCGLTKSIKTAITNLGHRLYLGFSSPRGWREEEREWAQKRGRRKWPSTELSALERNGILGPPRAIQSPLSGTVEAVCGAQSCAPAFPVLGSAGAWASRVKAEPDRARMLCQTGPPG